MDYEVKPASVILRSPCGGWEFQKAHRLLAEQSKEK
jgi:hypothetical protein